MPAPSAGMTTQPDLIALLDTTKPAGVKRAIPAADQFRTACFAFSITLFGVA